MKKHCNLVKLAVHSSTSNIILIQSHRYTHPIQWICKVKPLKSNYKLAVISIQNSGDTRTPVIEVATMPDTVTPITSIQSRGPHLSAPGPETGRRVPVKYPMWAGAALNPKILSRTPRTNAPEAFGSVSARGRAHIFPAAPPPATADTPNRSVFGLSVPVAPG
ncbi:hypothetical protein SEVIR_7G216866v4 [Setaria viridis]